MRVPPAYAIFCAVMLGLFGYTRFNGMAMFGSSNTLGGGSTSSSGSSSSGGGYHNTGTSGGSHK